MRCEEDNNSLTVQLFDCGGSDVFGISKEKEVPLPYFLHSGGNGYINFEEEYRRSSHNWSFSDELKKGIRWDTKEQLIGGEQNEDDMDDEALIKHTRTYIMQLIGGLLFPEKANNNVHLMYLPLLGDLEPDRAYSWGSAVLAHIYRQLCRATDKKAQEVSGALLLLQIWTWDRLPFIPIRRRQSIIEGAPLAARWGVLKDVTRTSTHVVSQYRIILDRQTEDRVNWQPYGGQILRQLPVYCTRDAAMWTSRVPLICFHIVEWHLPDRVLRQFGGIQRIPQICNTEVDLHTIDLRNKTDSGWQTRHDRYIRLWESPADRIVQVVSAANPVSGDYFAWYLRHTRRWISKTGATLCYMVEQIKNMGEYARNMDDPAFHYFEDVASETLKNAGFAKSIRSERAEDEDYPGSGLIDTKVMQYQIDRRTPNAPRKSRANMRNQVISRAEASSSNPPDFGTQSLNDSASQITQIDRCLMIQPPDCEDSAATTKQYRCTRRHH